MNGSSSHCVCSRSTFLLLINYNLLLKINKQISFYWLTILSNAIPSFQHFLSFFSWIRLLWIGNIIHTPLWKSTFPRSMRKLSVVLPFVLRIIFFYHQGSKGSHRSICLIIEPIVWINVPIIVQRLFHILLNSDNCAILIFNYFLKLFDFRHNFWVPCWRSVTVHVHLIYFFN